MSGFLAGVFWGAVVGGGVLVVSSLALDRQELSLPQPSASAVEVPGGSEFDQARPESDPVLPATEARPAGADAGEVETVEAPDDSADAPPVLDTAALDAPEPELDAPETLGDAPEPVVDETEIATETAVEEAPAVELETPEAPGTTPVTQAEEPEAPAAAEEPEAPEVIVIEITGDPDPAEDAPSEPQVAIVTETDVEADQPDTETLPEVTTQGTAPSLTQPELGSDTALPDSSAERETAALSESPEAPRLPQVAQEPSLPDAQPEPEAAPEVAAQPEPEPEAAPAAENTPAADTSAALEQDAEPTESDAANETPSFFRQVEPLEVETETAGADAPSDNGTARLPSIRRAGVAASDAPTEEVADALAEVDDVPTDGPALQMFASEFDNPDGAPTISIVLIQKNASPVGQDVLQALPAHVTFAVDANSANVSTSARAYRTAGHEVVLVPSLPAGAAPQDVEQAMQVNLTKVPEAVAIMDASGSSFQSDRFAVRQVVDVVADTGHGMITFPRGLNTAHQEAQRANVPTGLIFRNIDAGGETQEQIRRALDRAAFRARQNEGVILVGTTAETTIAAIVEWALGNRAANVTIAPVSVALTTTGG